MLFTTNDNILKNIDRLVQKKVRMQNIKKGTKDII